MPSCQQLKNHGALKFLLYIISSSPLPPGGPLLELLQFINISVILIGPKLDTVLQIRLY